MTNMQYTMKGNYQFPNLSVPPHSSQPLNKYGRMRAKYLAEQRPFFYQKMLLNETLTSHLQLSVSAGNMSITENNNH